MITPRAITKWLPPKDIPFLEAEEKRLINKEWTVEIQSKKKDNGSTVYALIVLKRG